MTQALFSVRQGYLSKVELEKTASKIGDGVYTVPQTFKTRGFSGIGGFPAEFWLRMNLDKYFKYYLAEHLIRVEVRV